VLCELDHLYSGHGLLRAVIVYNAEEDESEDDGEEEEEEEEEENDVGQSRDAIQLRGCNLQWGDHKIGHFVYILVDFSHKYDGTSETSERT
jgi:hypothetical protein